MRSGRVAEALDAIAAHREQQIALEESRARPLFDTPTDASAWQAPLSASKPWVEHALAVVRALSEKRETLSVLDVAPLVEETVDMRALGSVMLAASRKGWLEADGWIDGGRERHSRPIRRWRSLVRVAV